MKVITEYRRQQRSQIEEQVRKEYNAFKTKGLKLDLTRGKPSQAQLDLSAELLSLPGSGDSLAGGAIDCRNYGGIQGLAEARVLFSGMMGATPDCLIIANNSSLALMHDVVVFSLLKGTCDGNQPWLRQGPIGFICPVPGYDRHFTICEEYGIRMIPTQLGQDGPDMNEVERLVERDPSIKGIWCVPKYSNPTGTIYSDATIDRLASMKTAAPDFRIYWDNAYSVHHLTSERVEIANILSACVRSGHPNRALVFASTSKITLAGAGLALFASSKANVEWLLARFRPRTIGPDKINQLRHVIFLKSEAGILRLMEQHRLLIAPKFQKVIEVFDDRMASLPNVSWTRPKGGYFITLTVPEGYATRVVTLAKEAGVEVTPAGATHPYGKDPEDRTIRIAPTFPEIAQVEKAAQGLALCVLLATAEEVGKH